MLVVVGESFKRTVVVPVAVKSQKILIIRNFIEEVLLSFDLVISARLHLGLHTWPSPQDYDWTQIKALLIALQLSIIA